MSDDSSSQSLAAAEEKNNLTGQQKIEDLLEAAQHEMAKISEIVEFVRTSATTISESQTQLNVILADAQAKMSDINSAASQVLAAKTKISDEQAVIATKSDHIQHAQEHADKVRGDLDRALTSATQQAVAAEGQSSRAQAAAENISALVLEAQKSKSLAEADLNSIAAAKKTTEDSAALIRGLADKASVVESKILDYENKLTDLVSQCEAQLRTITNLLPGAASAGLAHSFASRAAILEGEKKFWLRSFVVGLILIIVSICLLTYFLPPLDFMDPIKLLSGILVRIPFLGPSVWFSWYSAIQYGTRLRVQEDYEFKKATAEAFIGYRDHMEHLAAVAGVKEGNTALTALANKTVDVLSNEPLRIYKDSHEEATPLTRIIGIVNRVVSPEKNN